MSIGSSVQYIAGDGQIMAATVVETFQDASPDGENRRNLKVHMDGSNSLHHGFTQEEVNAGFAWKTSIHMGDEPNHWRPIPDTQ